MSEERGVWQTSEPMTPEECREWYRRAVENLWPGLTEYAAQTVPDGVIVGVADGRVILSSPVKHGRTYTTAWPRPPQCVLEPPLIGSSPGVSVSIDYPKGVWPQGLQLPLRHPDVTALETSLLAGMALWFDRDSDAWRFNTTTPTESPLSQKEAEEAAAYLRGRSSGPDGERRNWFRRGKPAEDLPWRKGPIWRDLNGPTTEPWARWFSTANDGVVFHNLDLPSTLREAARVCGHRRASVAARWDWRSYQLTTARQLFSHHTLVSNLLGPEDGPLAPWPVWADERTAWRRLVQRAAELLFEANADAWQTSEPRRRVKVPAGDEWPVIAALIEHASADARLYFGEESQPDWGGLSYARDFGPETAVVLWRVFHGWWHLRRCVNCGRWVVSGGQRARTLCDAACKQARHRRTPGANRG